MADTPSLGASIAEAADEYKDMALDADGTVVAAEEPETAESDEAAQTDVDTETPEGEAETPADAEGTAAAPDRYFEVDLSGLPEEERVKVIDALKARDDEIGTLLRGRAEGSETDGASGDEGEQAAPEPMTDDAILQALGLDPENNPFDENTAKVALPLVRGLQQVQGQLAELTEQRELEALDKQWNTSLDKLETEHGELPIDRLSLLEFAAAQGISDPATAFWRVFGPANRQVEAAVKAAQERVTAASGTTKTKKASTGKRPAGSTATEEVPAEGATLRETVSDAAKKVLTDLGL